MAGILWLASYPKSGSTWLRAFLANYFKDLPRPVDINTLSRFAFTESTRAFYRRVSDQPLERLSSPEIYRLRPQVHALIAREMGRTAFVKIHSAVTQVGGVDSVTPGVTQGAVYVLRNPLDVAVSFARHFGCELDEAITALASPELELEPSDDQVEQLVGSWSAHAVSWIDAPGLAPCVLRFEDMARNPVETFGRLIGYLGLADKPQRLQKAIHFSSFRELARQEELAGFKEHTMKSERFFREGRVGVWRAHLSDQQVARLIEDHGAAMNRFGYLDSRGDPVF